MTMEKSKWKAIILLAIILLAALALRLWGIGFGLPFTYHYDEHFYVTGALNLGKGMVGEHPDPTGYTNILFGEYVVYFLLGRLLGIFDSISAFETAYRTNASAFYLLGRFTSALFGSATVLVTYGLGKRLFNRTTALISALLIAAAFLHVRDSHFAVTDITVTFFVALTIYLCVATIQKKSVRLLLLSAVAGGFALATKWTTWPIALPIGLAVLGLAPIQPGSRNYRQLLRLAFIAGTIFLGVFLISSFEFFMSPAVFWKDMLVELQSGSGGGFNIWAVDFIPGWLFYLKVMTWGIGWVMLFFAVLGVGILIFQVIQKKELPLFTFMAFPVIFFLYMGASRHYFARYAIPLIPFLAVFAAIAIDRISAKISAKNRAIFQPLLVSLILLALIQPFISSLRFDDLLTQVDTRTLAWQWIEANLPPGSKIAVDDAILAPPLSTEERLSPGSRKTYTVAVPNFRGLYTGGNIADLRLKGYDYLIASSFIYNIPLIDAQAQGRRQQFYANLDSEYRLLKAFYPNETQTEPPFIFDEMYGPAISLWQRERPGPVLKIYAVNPASP